VSIIRESPHRDIDLRFPKPGGPVEKAALSDFRSRTDICMKIDGLKRLTFFDADFCCRMKP
jgi:hypothetical protein